VHPPKAVGAAAYRVVYGPAEGAPALLDRAADLERMIPPVLAYHSSANSGSQQTPNYDVLHRRGRHFQRTAAYRADGWRWPPSTHDQHRPPRSRSPVTTACPHPTDAAEAPFVVMLTD
jgi:hypothetical protein